MATTMHRPIGITIIAILAAVATVIAAFHILQYLHLMPFFLGPVTFFGSTSGALVAAPLGGISLWGWFFVALRVLLDVGSHLNTYASRTQAQMMYRRT